MLTGALIHGCYLGLIFFAIGNGMSAGVAALIVALQPLLTALVARVMLGETVTRVQIIALMVALFGVVLVYAPKLTGAGISEGISLTNLFAVLISVSAISIGSVYQKKYVPATDLRLGAAAQYFGALIPLAICSYFFETQEIKWTGEFIFALVWLVFALSLGAVTLLMVLIRRDSSAKTASLFYLVPVSTAIIAYLMFDELLEPVQLVGMAIVIAAVAAAGRYKKTPPQKSGVLH
jgi:drug/metabolite transporter (DMT)-like permease